MKYYNTKVIILEILFLKNSIIRLERCNYIFSPVYNIYVCMLIYTCIHIYATINNEGKSIDPSDRIELLNGKGWR